MAPGLDERRGAFASLWPAAAWLRGLLPVIGNGNGVPGAGVPAAGVIEAAAPEGRPLHFPRPAAGGTMGWRRPAAAGVPGAADDDDKAAGPSTVSQNSASGSRSTGIAAARLGTGVLAAPAAVLASYTALA